jgi:copper chaperone CopZ
MEDQMDTLATSIFAIKTAGQPGQVERMRKAITGMPGVLGLEINYLLDTAKVRYDPNKLTLAQIKAAMK